MKREFVVEVHRKVYFDQEGHFLTVRPSVDFHDGNVLLHAEKSEQEWFGTVHLDIPAGFARLLGEALIAVAGEVEAAAIQEAKEGV